MVSNIANLPETLKIRTSDNEVIEVTGKLVSECLVLKKLFDEEDNPNANEIALLVNSYDLKNAVKALEMCDLETPHVSVTEAAGNRALVQTHHNVVEFFESLQDDDMIMVSDAAEALECQRLTDLCLAFLVHEKVEFDTRDMRQRFARIKDDFPEEEEDEEEPIPEAPEAVPEAPETIPEAQEAIPEAQEAIPEAPEANPEAQEAVPEAQEAIPEAQEAIPEAQEAIPEAQLP